MQAIYPPELLCLKIRTSRTHCYPPLTYALTANLFSNFVNPTKRRLTLHAIYTPALWAMKTWPVDETLWRAWDLHYPAKNNFRLKPDDGQRSAFWMLYGKVWSFNIGQSIYFSKKKSWNVLQNYLRSWKNNTYIARHDDGNVYSNFFISLLRGVTFYV